MIWIYTYEKLKRMYWDTFISVTLNVSNAPHNNKFNIQNTTDLIQATTAKIEDETKISVNVTLRHL